MTKKIFLQLFLIGLNFHLLAQTNVPFSILISEVMFDPSPSVQLADNEYVEFFNTTQDSISLKGWEWQVGNRSLLLPDFSIPPGECSVMIPKSSDETYYGDSFSPEKWITLPNSGQYMVLRDDKQNIIHFMSYSPGLVSNVLKRAGGWSLELRSETYPCSADSWLVSEDPKGGSPGSVSFGDSHSGNYRELKASRIGFLSPEEGLVHFSDYLMPDTKAEDLVILNEDNIELPWSFYDDRTDCLKVSQTQSNSKEEIQSIRIRGSAKSCNYQPLQLSELKWGIPVLPETGDILLSEIMFDPHVDGVEYIELFNASEKVVEANTLIIATLNELGEVKDFSISGGASNLIFPNCYLVLTSDELWLRQFHPSIPYGVCHERKNLPSLVNTGGVIQVLNSHHVLIDEAEYNPDWHYPRIKDTKGISLERISYTHAANSEFNWYSAASLHDHATPGLPNSQYHLTDLDSNHNINLINPVIMTNEDGAADFALIQFSMDKIGYSGQVEVRDQRGFLVKEIHPWGLLPSNGMIFWNGIDGSGRPVKDGIYILLFNFSHPEGQRKRWKKALGVYNH